MNSIILVDDDNNFIGSFKNDAYAVGITVAPKNSLDGLKQLLPAQAHKYAAVVLDIKGLLTDTQAKEDASFIASALKYLDSSIPGFPRFILTGDESEFETLKKYYKEEKLFLKKPDHQVQLLQALHYCVQNAEPLRIKRENPDVFDAFTAGLLPANKEQTLLNIFSNAEEANPANFRGIIGDIREMHEEIYKSINNRNKAVFPDQFITGNGSPTFNAALFRHLEGNLDRNNNYNPTTQPYQDSTIQSTTKFIHTACSEYLHGTSRTGYSINRYTIKSLINGLMELIIWSKQY